MQFDLSARTASLSVGELADFAVGPRDGGDGTTGIWRAQLGSHWHREMETRTQAEHPEAAFEVTINGSIFHDGWTLQLSGRIDQVLPEGEVTVLREIKTLTTALPVDEAELRAAYPHYFAQLACYLALRRIDTPDTVQRGELVFVETANGLTQTIRLTRDDEAQFDVRLARVTAFLNQHRHARERRHRLVITPAFATLRPGQEDTREHLETALAAHPIVAFEAPTGFGKTGVMLETTLAALRDGRCDRLLYLTSKSTGQLQVVDTLRRMTATPSEVCHLISDKHMKTTGDDTLAVWHVRNKREHCINDSFHCVRDNCRHLRDLEARWPGSGLDRFHLFADTDKSLPELRRAGTDAAICPYEITRTALAYQDVWIGDYNYVFAPRNRTLFTQQPGWDPARTWLIVDEAHNLASRVADAHSATLDSADLRAALAVLDHQSVSKACLRAWEALTLLVAGLRRVDALDLDSEEDLGSALAAAAEAIAATPLDHAALGPELSETLWRPAELVAWLESPGLSRLLWVPADGRVDFTCLDAAPVIGETLRSFNRVLLASATVGPVEAASENWGLVDTPPEPVGALTPWRDGAYDVAVDLRVDTRYQQRTRHLPTTARTVAALVETAEAGVVVFFPSYRYAENVVEALAIEAPGVHAAVQPRLPDLAAQAEWVEQSLTLADALFLVLGSSFAEGIDTLGGRVSHAMVVGPALPEVNARQRAWQEELRQRGAEREAAFDRVYRQPGLQKVNQGLGRLVRAPGQRTRVLLHCQRFVDPAYARWLAPDYQLGTHLATDQELATWLKIDG